MNRDPGIMVMHQERVVRLPGCPSNDDLCPLNVFTEIYRDSIDESKCNFEDVCRLSDK